MLTPAQIGACPPQKETPLLVQGAGCFTDDARLSAPLYLAFGRSQMASGRLVALDLTKAAEAPGVWAVHGAADVAHLGDLSVNPVLPLSRPMRFETLVATDITALGQPIAAVLATSPQDAMAAADLVSPTIAEASPQPRTIAHQSWQVGDAAQVLDSAAYVVDCTIRHPRLAPSPLEPRAIAVAYDPQTDAVTIWHSTQTPHRTRQELSEILGVNSARIRVIARHVGGAFGMKASLYPEEVCAVWAAFHHKRSVKWTATRSEDFLSATQGRGVISHGRLALDESGRFLALQARTNAPIGPWLPNSGLVTAWNAARILPSAYRVEALEITTTARTDGLGPMGIYRGAGRPEANCLMERLIDKAARATGLDPFELRLRNLLTPAALPHQTATGNRLDSGNYAQALTTLHDRADYPALLATQAQRRAAGGLFGIGIGFYLEPSGNGWESARVTLAADGRVTVASGSSSQGQGRETTLAQIAADTLGVEYAAITVLLADTDATPPGIGALASRSTAIGGSAVLQACQNIAQRRATGEALPITAELRYENKGQAWGYGAYLVAMSLCRETGLPTVEQVTCVDDAGRIVNPALVEGQIRGGFAMGLGEALMERVVYDAHGQLLTGSLMDYALPRAADMPPIDIHKFETPSPMNALGAKGVGEAGTIGAPPAILNAAIDALSPLGVTDLDMPLTALSLWQAISSAENATREGVSLLSKSGEAFHNGNTPPPR